MVTLMHEPRRRELPRDCRGLPVVIGLVNNMPDAALRSTERQFNELLVDAAGGRPIVLRYFSLPGVPRSAATQEDIDDRYEDITALWRGDIDGLIVTGTEPRAANLRSEPYWLALTKLVDWAAERTIGAIWSCLAAHAAVYYLDGIERRPLGPKLSGVFECIRTANDPLVDCGPARWHTPHSRYNELPEAALLSCGYELLARATGGGADLFVKRGRSVFVFLQGHPEYDSGALLREYRRDVGRFLTGTADCHPEIPRHYLNKAATAALLDFRERALLERDPALLASFPTIVAQDVLRNAWRDAAVRLYANWLSFLEREKARRNGPMIRAARSVRRLQQTPAYG